MFFTFASVSVMLAACANAKVIFEEITPKVSQDGRLSFTYRTDKDSYFTNATDGLNVNLNLGRKGWHTLGRVTKGVSHECTNVEIIDTTKPVFPNDDTRHELYNAKMVLCQTPKEFKTNSDYYYIRLQHGNEISEPSPYFTMQNGVDAEDTTSENIEKAKDTVMDNAEKAKDTMMENGEKAKDNVMNNAEKAKDIVMENGEKAKDTVMENGEKAKDTVMDNVKEGAEDLKSEGEPKSSASITANSFFVTASVIAAATICSLSI